MTYNKVRTLVFVETKLFTQLVKEYLSDDEYGELQQYIIKNPEVGKVISGSGGVRKVRWAREGMGKSGVFVLFIIGLKHEIRFIC